MSVTERPDVENIPADLDRFLGTSSTAAAGAGRSSTTRPRTASTSTCASRAPSSRPTTASSRSSSTSLAPRTPCCASSAGLPLQCRLYATDGRDLTAVLHARGSSYLDDNARGSGMRRRLAWLSFRRRFFVRVAPGALLWAAAVVLVVGVVGVRLDVALAIALLALGVQAVTLFVLASQGRLACRAPAGDRSTTAGGPHGDELARAARRR